MNEGLYLSNDSFRRRSVASLVNCENSKNCGPEEDDKIVRLIGGLLDYSIVPNALHTMDPAARPPGVEVAINAYKKGQYSTPSVFSELVPAKLELRRNTTCPSLGTTSRVMFNSRPDLSCSIPWTKSSGGHCTDTAQNSTSNCSVRTNLSKKRNGWLTFPTYTRPWIDQLYYSAELEVSDSQIAGQSDIPSPLSADLHQPPSHPGLRNEDDIDAEDQPIPWFAHREPHAGVPPLGLSSRNVVSKPLLLNGQSLLLESDCRIYESTSPLCLEATTEIANDDDFPASQLATEASTYHMNPLFEELMYDKPIETLDTGYLPADGCESKETSRRQHHSNSTSTQSPRLSETFHGLPRYQCREQLSSYNTANTSSAHKRLEREGELHVHYVPGPSDPSFQSNYHSYGEYRIKEPQALMAQDSPSDLPASEGQRNHACLEDNVTAVPRKVACFFGQESMRTKEDEARTIGEQHKRMVESLLGGKRLGWKRLSGGLTARLRRIIWPVARPLDKKSH